MPPRFLIFQHSPWEGPGRFLLRAAEHLGIKLAIVEVWRQPIPGLSRFDGLIVLGGGPNVNQERQYPFLTEEKRTIRDSIAADRPYLGFCLGHQLLADALLAEVGANHRPSVGFTQGFLTSDGRKHPVFQNYPRSFSLFKWHAQAVITPAPKTLDVLATSADCQVEAISVPNRPHILGLQFDNHAADPHDVAAWLSKDQKWLASLPLQLDPAAIQSQARQLAASMEQEFRHLLRNYFRLLA
jgi:GMP synthase (glutamine-hydrolysing)